MATENKAQLENNISTNYVNEDPIQHVHQSNTYVSVPLLKSSEITQKTTSPICEEVVSVGDEGISDCSPGASERDSSSPTLQSGSRFSKTTLSQINKSPSKIVDQESKYPDLCPTAKSSPAHQIPSDDTHDNKDSEQHEKEVSELRLDIAKYKVDLERALDHIHYLEEVNLQQGLARAELEAKYQTLLQRFENAKKEKEATVMRYAVSEKNVIEQKHINENLEKQLRESSKETELLNNKISLLNSEKNRICQMFDNKCHELTTSLREHEKLKSTLGTAESTIKSLKSALKNENEARKEMQITIDSLTLRLQTANVQTESAKREAQESIRAFRESQENKAFLLDKQLKEANANLILARHECSDREKRSHNLQIELDSLRKKYEQVIKENNEFSIKIQNLEQDRLENDRKLGELRESKNKETEQTAKTQALETQLEQLKVKLAGKEDKFILLESQVEQLKQQNIELQTDLDSYVRRGEEMLKFTQTLTEKNVRLQSEYSTIETKVQQLQCEQESLKRSNKEMQNRLSQMTQQLDTEKNGRANEIAILTRHLAEKTQENEKLKQELEYQKGENQVLKRKFETSIKEMSKELHQCHKQIEKLESASEISKEISKISISKSPSQSITDLPTTPIKNNDKEIAVSYDSDSSQTTHSTTNHPIELDKHALLDHVIRLQRISARKSEKLDFLESHVQTLVGELQKKSRLLQDYMMREQTGTLTSNVMDNHKAEVAKSKGVMASMFNSRVSDNNLTLELSLDINRKLQAVLEDTMLKNITLKESVDTLGKEIERLKNQTKLNNL